MISDFERHAAPLVRCNDNLVGVNAIGDVQQTAAGRHDPVARIVRQARIDVAETLLMHERHVILQVLALSAQYPVEVPGTLARTDHQEMRTEQPMMPQDAEDQTRQHGAACEAE